MARYFTCKFYPSGISDQIGQLQWVYNVGKRLGLEYVHRPAISRWSTLDYAKFFGLGLGELPYEDYAGLGLRKVDARAAAVAITTGRESEFRHELAHDNRIIELSHPGRTWWRKSSPPSVEVEYPLNWQGRFWQANADCPSPFRSHRTAVAVHLRRGDRVWVRDGDRYIMPYVGRVRRRSELNHEYGMGNNMRRAPSVAQYEKAIRAIADQLGPDNVEVRVYSDGFLDYSIFRVIAKMGFNVLRLGLRFRLQECMDLLRAMPRIGKYMDEIRLEGRRLDSLADMESVTAIVGRQDDQTVDAILAFAHADICVGARKGIFPHFDLHGHVQQYISVGFDNDRWISSIEELGAPDLESEYLASAKAPAA